MFDYEYAWKIHQITKMLPLILMRKRTLSADMRWFANPPASQKESLIQDPRLQPTARLYNLHVVRANSLIFLV
jgi:hypothetical protein